MDTITVWVAQQYAPLWESKSINALYNIPLFFAGEPKVFCQFAIISPFTLSPPCVSFSLCYQFPKQEKRTLPMWQRN